MSLNRIDPERDIKGNNDPNRETTREENIARAARDFRFERGPGQVEYIRELRQRAQEGTGDYDLTALLWQLAGIRPDPIQTFDKFKLKKNPTLKEAFQAAKDWCQHKGPPLLTLAGTPGVGKSFLAIAAAQEIITKNGLVMYWRVDELLEAYQRQTFDRHRSDMDIDLKAVTFLIVDDLGTQRSTPWGEQFLDGLIDNRYRLKARLMCCTNGKSEDLSPRIADRLADRLYGRVVQIDAPSHRRERAE